MLYIIFSINIFDFKMENVVIMEKNIMLFIWFIKFGFLRPRDEYYIHDHIKEQFCPEYIPESEFDEKEQILRDTPGPVGIKYAYYIGGKVNGIFGAVIAVTALLLPVIAVTIAIILSYGYLFAPGSAINNYVTKQAISGMHAAALGLIAAQLYKIVYFNKVNKKSIFIILPSALVFLFLPDMLGEEILYNLGGALIPFYIVIVIISGIICGIIHDAAVKYRIKNPSTKYIDPYSKKAIKMRDRQLREEEYEMQKYRDDNTIKLRRQQLEEEDLKKKQKNKFDE